MRAVYGISFPVKSDAVTFGEAVDAALVDLHGSGVLVYVCITLTNSEKNWEGEELKQ